jgi:hypothetical protein
MGIESFIKTVCVQRALYWPEPVPDGYGGIQFGEPQEIPVRWDEKTEVITDSKGDEVVSKAEIMTTIDLDEGGWLWLGEMDDLPESVKVDQLGEVLDPRKIPGAYKIKRFDKVSMIFSTKEFVRKAYV